MMQLGVLVHVLRLELATNQRRIRHGAFEPVVGLTIHNRLYMMYNYYGLLRAADTQCA